MISIARFTITKTTRHWWQGTKHVTWHQGVLFLHLCVCKTLPFRLPEADCSIYIVGFVGWSHHRTAQVQMLRRPLNCFALFTLSTSSCVYVFVLLFLCFVFLCLSACGAGAAAVNMQFSTGWSRATVFYNFSRTGIKKFKNGQTQPFLLRIYMDILIFWCLIMARWKNSCLLGLCQNSVNSPPCKG